LKYYYDEIDDLLEQLKFDVQKVQLLLSSMDSPYWGSKLSDKEKKGIEKASAKIRKFFDGFTKKIMGTKVHANFDVFIEITKQVNSIGKDIKMIHQMLGPLLAYVYSTSILDKMDVEELEQDDEEEEENEDTKEDSKDIFNSVIRGTKYGFQFEDDEEEDKDEAPQTKEDKESDLFADLDQARETSVENITSTASTDGHDNDRTAFYDTKDDDDSLDSKQKAKYEAFRQTYCGEHEARKLLKEQDVPEPTQKPLKDDGSTRMITVFAASITDISNFDFDYQQIVDFMFELRDSNMDCRVEVDEYLNRFKLKPSEHYSEKRIVPNTNEITELVKKHKLDKNAVVGSNFKLTLDIRNNKARCKAFFKDVKIYQMPKIQLLRIVNVNKVDAVMFGDYLIFLNQTMVSKIDEFYYEAGKELDMTCTACTFPYILPRVEHKFMIRNFIIEEKCINMILCNLKKAKHIEFADCNLKCMLDDLKLDNIEESDLKSITISFKDRKIVPDEIMNFLKVLVKPLSKTPILNTLTALYLPKKVPLYDVSRLFSQNGFGLKIVINL
jgi:hypothetical protein